MAINDTAKNLPSGIKQQAMRKTLSSGSEPMGSLTDRIAALSPAKRALLQLRLKKRGPDTSGTIPRTPNRNSVPLSFSQQRLWFLDQYEPNSSVYNVPSAQRLKGFLNVAALEQSLNEIVRRHEALRTTFAMVGTEPVQIVSPAWSLSLAVLDLSEHAEGQRESEAQRLTAEEASKPFDLARGPLFRATLLKLAEDDHILLLTMHHIVSDGWSMGVLYRELSILYGVFTQGKPSPLAELPIQYADYAVWQREWLRGEVLESQLSYWKKQLEGIPAVLNLPTDRPRPPVQSFRGARRSIELSRELTEGLKALSRKEGVTLFMTLLAAFQTLLYRYTGQDDIVVGSPIANRNQTELEGLIGFFVNTLVLRADFSANPSFRELLQRVREMALGAYAHQDLAFEKLVEELRPERDLSRSPLFQVMFVLQNAPRAEPKFEGLGASPVRVSGKTAKFDLTLSMEEAADGLRASLQYSTDLFNEDTIKRMLGHFEVLLESMVDNPGQCISTFPILSEAERYQLLVEWNDTSADYSRDKCIHQLFEEQVERTPDALAVVFEGRQLTYRELNQRANQVAHYLIKQGVVPETLAGICVDRSIEMVVGLLGILKAGGAYVPLDPSYPKERLAFMVADARLTVLLTVQHLVERLPERSARIVCLDAHLDNIARESDENTSVDVGSGNLAYVLYTSGSTGQPKAVAIEHHSPVAFLFWARSAFTAADMAGVLASTSICFDLSVFELFAPLTSGGKVVLVENALALPRLAAASEVTLINTVPSAIAELLHLGGIPRSVRTINLAGEPLKTNLVQQIYAKTSANHVYDLYGPSEDTTYSTYALRTPDGPQTIGQPIANTQIFLLDPHLQPVPVGVTGELYLRGGGLARGYLNRPALTCDKFIPDPFGPQPGARLYKTGDLARYSPDGNIELLGRSDHQVKIRGYRIELGEIESVLGQHPRVRESVVLGRDDAPQDSSAPFGIGKRLVAYVVPSQEPAPTIHELRSFIKQQLPEYMVPSAYVFLDSLPLTTNGKVDRKALPMPDRSRPELNEIFSAPRTPVEELLANIWAEVLKLDRVGIHDNFFEMGGHSLLATQVVSRVRAAFRVELPLRSLFENSTVASMAECIENTRHQERGSEGCPVVAVPRYKQLALSFAQQRLWFLDRLEPNNSHYNVPSAQRFKGSLDVGALERSLNEIVKRHEALRTTFTVVAGQPVQRILPSLTLPLSVTDLSDLPESEREDEARRLISKEAQRPFDLERGPLMRSVLLHLGSEDHVLLLTVHHIACDGWSMNILYRELSLLYEAFSNGEPSPLMELPIQYADFAQWQRNWLEGEVLETQLGYWKKQLEKVQTLDLFTDRPRPAVQSYRGARESIVLSRELTEALKTFSRQQGVTLFMTLLAAFQTLLYRYTGQNDIAVGSVIAGRNRREIEGLIGFFVNTLVLRTDVSGSPTFKELLARVRGVCLDAYSHQDLPFEKLVEELQPQRNLSQNPLFQVMFVLQNTPSTELRLQGLRASPAKIDGETAKFDLTLSLREEAQGTRVSLQYNFDLFDPATIRRMMGNFQVLLNSIVANPDENISELPILTEAENRQLLTEWNDTEREYPKDKCISELFESQVKKSPDAIALAFEDRQLSYKELNERANQLARYLRQLGVGPETLVAICMERSIEMVVGLLGILKAGGVYLPLDPEYPKERLAFMLEDTKAAVVLTEGRLLNRLPGTSAEIIRVDQEWKTIANETTENLSGATADNLACVIYTSGSTGRPKGIEIPHRGIARLLFGVDYVQLDPHQTFLHLAPISFDASTFEIWGALLHGAKCILFPGKVPSARELGELLHRHNVSVLWLTASLFNAVIDEVPAALSCVRQLLIGGEALSVPHVRHALPLLPHTKIINGYGPTESTTFTCCYPISRQSAEFMGSIPIGRPIANTKLYVLDNQMKPVPVGIPGELYIGGDGLARGYRNRPELTAEAFVCNPFSREPASRLYRTGDRVRYLPDGNVEFLGRMDDQVKIRGFRIEPGEIETILTQCSSIERAVVLARAETHEAKQLVAYIVPKPDASPSATELKDLLRSKLPAYMVPSAFVFLNELPLTANGKVDRLALPAPGIAQPEVTNRFAAPRDDLERQLSEIYANLLGVRNVSIKDNFFDLGGHSLLALRVVSQIEHTLGKTLPIAALFQAPTVEQLADLLRREEQLSDRSSLVPIQTNGSKSPFFWVHGDASDAFLPRYLGPDQPVYGLRHQSENGYPALYTTVEDIAAHYLDELRAVHPDGPYYLGGFCFGAMVAFEMAQQLKKQHQEVDLLVLLDPSMPKSFEESRVPSVDTPSSLDNGSTIADEFQRHLRGLAVLRPKDKFIYVLQRSKGKINELAVKIVSPLKTMAWPIIWTLYLKFGYRIPHFLRSPYILKIYSKAIQKYVPKVYPGRITVFARKESFRTLRRWDALALGGLDIHEVTGPHEDIVKEPHAKVWAEKLKIILTNSTTRCMPTTLSDLAVELPKTDRKAGQR